MIKRQQPPAPRQVQYPRGYPPAPRLQKRVNPEPRKGIFRKDGIFIEYPWAGEKQPSKLEPGDNFIFLGIVGFLLYILSCL
jgi:hypothetical protein